MISASEALERLREGNRRFVSDVRGSAALVTQTRRTELAEGQEPFAIILGCSDSRRTSRDRLRPRLGRSLRHPRCRKHRRVLSNRQRGICRRTVRHTARCGFGSLAMRSCSCYVGRTHEAEGEAVAESSIDRGPHSPIGGRVARDGTEARFGGPCAARRSREHPRLRKPAATRLRSSRGADPKTDACWSWAPSILWKPGSLISSTVCRRVDKPRHPRDPKRTSI